MNKKIDSNQLIGKVINGYKVCEVLGEGYSGFVHRATKNRTSFAIKVIKPKLIHLDIERRKQLSRIKNQLRVRDKISHPNLIKIFEGGECSKTRYLYLIMEYLPVEEFLPLSRLNSSIEENKIRPLLGQIASAAEALHINNFVHRDIKPSNIMISKSQNRAILLDLGVLKNLSKLNENDFGSTDHPDLSDHTFYGTIKYSPYEILEPKVLKNMEYKYEAISFYQLGAILYVMITGKSLFHSEISIGGLIERIKNGIDENEFYNEVSKNIHDGLQKLAIKCLNPDWKGRIKAVSWTDFNFENLIPTIIMLYAGGTIGSKVFKGNSERGVRDNKKELANFFNKIERRLRRNYTQIYDPIKGLQFSLEWESLPQNDLILSENATPKTWNSIMKTLENIVNKYCTEFNQNQTAPLTEKNNRYIAGIIIMHGTDSLAYTAAALTFALKNLPCPIIITGSNQPPDEDSITEKDIISSKSDAWKNLMLSINFIQSFGHRYTELFIAFNSTIFHAVNLKKVPLYNAFEAALTSELAMDEPYTYQNIFFPKKYMFKLIDGIFCNNFYPINNSVHHATLIHENFHSRKDVYVDNSKFEISEYNNIKLELIINTPVTEYSHSSLKDRNVIILVGYDSGTFSSDPRHPLSKALKSWTEERKLIFLISEFGLFPTDITYKLHDEMEGKILVFELFGLIKETAIPFILSLLSKMGNLIFTDKFKRYSLNKKFEYIVKIFEKNTQWKNSLPGLIVGNPFEHKDHEERIKKSITTEATDYKAKEIKLFTLAESNTVYYNKAFKRKISGIGPIDKIDFNKLVALQRELFVWIILSKCKKPIAIGYGATEFKELNDMGYRLGKQVYKLIAQDITNSMEDNVTLVELAAHTTESVSSRTQQIAGTFASALKIKGIIDLNECKTQVLTMNKDTIEFKLEVDIKQHDKLDRNDVFAIETLDKREKDFFKLIKTGTPAESTNMEHRENIKKQLSNLASSSWGQHLEPIDWFMLGIFKGFIYASLCELTFDQWVRRFVTATNEKYEQILKDSIRTNIIISNNDRLKFEMTYISREVYEDDTKIA